MKKIILLLIAALLIPMISVAQSPEGRIPKTIVADVLAQMPAKNVKIYDQMMADLIGSGDVGIDLLMDGYKSDAVQDNTAVGYAIGGVVAYVTTPGKESSRNLIQTALIKALEKNSDRDVKAFFIRQLALIGDISSLPVLEKYALNANLSQEAVSAICEIPTEEAAKTIESIFAKIPSKSVAATAAELLKLSSQQATLISWLGSTDAQLQKAVLNALAAVGNEQSVKELRMAAAAVNNAYDATGATQAYLTILSRYPNPKEVNQLLKSQDANIRTVAINNIAANQGKAVLPHSLKALSDPSRAYRNAALVAAAPFADDQFYATLASRLAKATPETAVDIINFLGMQKAKSAIAKIIPYIIVPSQEQRIAAITALTRMDDPVAASAMIQALNMDSKEIAADIKNGLLWYKTNLNKELIEALPTASEQGKIAIIEVLAAKRADQAVDQIITMTTSTGQLSNAAYAALPNVVTDKQFDKLCAMLESQAKQPSQTAAVQKAIGELLSKMPKDKALATIKSRINSPFTAYSYYPTLSSIGSTAALNFLKDGVKSPDKQVKMAATNAIIMWPEFEASNTLLELYADKDNAQISTFILGAYCSLLTKSGYNDTQKLIYLRRALEIANMGEQKIRLLLEIGKCNTFNALQLAGNYLDDPQTQHEAGTAVMAIAVKDKQYAMWSPTTKAILEKFVATRGGGDAPYDKEAIKKYLSEAPTELGFVSIFNGKDLAGWKGLVQNPIARAKMKPEELVAAQAKADKIMQTGWEVRDGILYFTGKGDNLCTEKQYGDFEMYVDWKIQKHGDAGIYLRGAPQVQIWDTTLVQVGAQVGSGGLYNNQANPSKPLVVADNAIGDWNTFYIKMVGERVTVLLNGIKVVDNVILENYWDRSQPIFAVDQIELQAHGNEIAYRDIYVRELPQAKKFELSEQEQKEGYKVLFDGFSMNQWTGNTTDYVAQDGAIILRPKNGGGGNLYTKDQYTDFVFRFEFKLTPAANNGLGIRTTKSGDAAYTSNCELQILDSEHQVYKDLEIYQYHGSAYGIIPAKRGYLKPTGEWNYQEVEVRGTHVKVTLNGTVILDGDLAQASKNGTIDHKDHPGLKNTKGHLAFLGHGSEVYFKNIRIKEIKD